MESRRWASTHRTVPRRYTLCFCVIASSFCLKLGFHREHHGSPWTGLDAARSLRGNESPDLQMRVRCCIRIWSWMCGEKSRETTIRQECCVTNIGCAAQWSYTLPDYTLDVFDSLCHLNSWASRSCLDELKWDWEWCRLQRRPSQEVWMKMNLCEKWSDQREEKSVLSAGSLK
jgi:hypothetical protein